MTSFAVSRDTDQRLHDIVIEITRDFRGGCINGWPGSLEKIKYSGATSI
jgi:hypothetical protein